MPNSNTPSSIDISPEQLQIVKGILQRCVPNAQVWAFGSRAKGTAKKYSDLDLAIIDEQPLNLDVLAKLTVEFEESDLPWKVDVLDWHTADESFKALIERDKVELKS